jgi:hypothetical protein
MERKQRVPMTMKATRLMNMLMNDGVTAVLLAAEEQAGGRGEGGGAGNA